MRYQVIIHSLKIIDSDKIEETHLLSILPVLYLSLNYVELSTLTFLADFLLSQICDGCCNKMWTEMLPRTIQIIVSNGYRPFATPGDLTITGYNFRSKIVDKLIRSSNKWKKCVIPDIASMLKQGIPLTEKERYLLFDKLCNSMIKLDPSDLSTFSYHLFQASLFPKLFVGTLLSLDKYFRHYNWSRTKVRDSMEPSQPCVINVPESRFRREEDVIISQIFFQMEYNFPEESLTNALKEITMSPELLLTPFIFEALIALTRINQTSDAEKVAMSTLLTKTMHGAIKNNFAEMDIKKNSFFVNCLLEDFPKCISIEEISRLIIYDSKSGLEVITPGLFGLAYSFLRIKNGNPKLYHLSVTFLVNFLKNKPLYTRGVFERLIRMMIRNPKALQYRDALESFIFSPDIVLQPIDYHDVLKAIFDDIVYISGDSAANLLTIVLPLMKKSSGSTVRTLLIGMLRQTLSSCCIKTQQMTVYGCGLVLKQIKYDEVITDLKPEDLTIAYTMGYTLCTQMTQMDVDNLSPHDMMTLEIMGILSRAFCLNYEVKAFMYKGLKKAALENHKVLPHVIDFLNEHLKNFVETDPDIILKLDKLVEDNVEVVIVKDQIGVLTSILVSCIVEADSKKIKIENVFLRNFLTRSLDKVLSMTLNQFEIDTPFTQSKYVLASQLLNFMEAIMAFALWKATESNGYISKLLRIYGHYYHCMDELKKLAYPKTGNKRKKESWLKSVQNIESVWDFDTLLRFLSIYYNVDNKGLNEDEIKSLRTREDLKIKVLKSTAEYIRKTRAEPTYLQIKNSRSYFNTLSDITKIAFDRLFQSNEELCCEETLMVFAIFKEGVQSSSSMFSRKHESLIARLPNDGDKDFSKNVCRIITRLTAMIIKLCESTDNKQFNEKSYETRLLVAAISVIEIFLPYLDAGTPFCLQTYEFFFELNTEYTMNSKSLAIALKILFVLRQKSKPLGDFFTTVASLITTEYGIISTKTYTVTPERFALKSLTKHTLEGAAGHFLVSLKKYLEHNTFLLKKANSLIFRLTKIPGQRILSDQMLSQIREIEKMTITLLTSFCKTMRILSHAKIPLGKVADDYFRVLILLYSNGEKLARIFMNHNLLIPEEMEFFELRDLCLATRNLTRPVATFILYIEHLSTEAIINDEKLSGPQARKKVLKDSRYIPKYVYWFEKFSIEIIRLSMKTKQSFNKLLHLGIYRDFRLKTDELRDAIQKRREPLVAASQSTSDDFESISDNEDEQDTDNDDKESVNTFETSDSEIEEKPKKTRFAF
ncbi:Fanconi anemia group I protein homolog isoform X2 [Culicoides brevitarsis]